MNKLANHAAAALAAVFIATASIAGIVQVPQANASVAAAAPGTILA